MTKKQEDPNRDVKVTVSLSAEEHARLKTRAQAVGLRLAAWLRTLAIQADEDANNARQ